MAYLDLSELEDAFRQTPLCSRSRWAPLRFRREDYHGDPEQPLQEAVRQTVEARLGFRPKGPVRLLTNLRCFGLVFNPASFYYCFAEDGVTVEALMIEVTNTPWRERHAYVLDHRPDTHAPQKSPRRMHFDFEKVFHVSPFMEMHHLYRCDSTFPEGRLTVHLANHEQGSLKFDATLMLKRQEWNARSLHHTITRFPIMTAKVVGAIYFEALRLWLKGLRYQPHPGGLVPQSSSLSDPSPHA